jgi:vitamin B12 transporter
LRLAPGSAELQLSGERFDDDARRKRPADQGLPKLHTGRQFAASVSHLLRIEKLAGKRYEPVHNHDTGGRLWFVSLRYCLR